jgi:hypothetical protein
VTATKAIITVMPDYGMGPYAWEKPVTDETPYVGICIATEFDKLETEDGTTVSDELHIQFCEWTGKLERFAEQPQFDWKSFHQQGIKLSQILSRELGARFRVVYHKPCEDPNHEIETYVAIAGDA